MFRGADRQRRLHARYVWRRCQLAGEKLLKALQITADYLKNKIDFTVQHVTFTHFRERFDVIFEAPEISLCLALEAHHGKHRDGKAQLGRIELRVIAANDPGIFQCTHSPQARRGC